MRLWGKYALWLQISIIFFNKGLVDKKNRNRYRGRQSIKRWWLGIHNQKVNVLKPSKKH